MFKTVVLLICGE